MGKATIISDNGEGSYTIQPEWNTAIATARIARLTAENADIDARLGTISTEISDAEFDYNYAGDVLKAALINEDPDEEIESKQRDLLTKQSAWQALKQERSSLQLKKVSNQKQITTLQAVTATPPTVQAWCADYTEGMSGVVGTIEIGRRDVTPIIKPGWQDGAGAVFAGDGQLAPLMSNSAAATFYNLAMLPGAAKWKPLYRTGTASGVDKTADTMNVTLDPLTIAGINCNAESSLTALPVVYMDCNAEAFEDGDGVLVNMATNTVIGFSAAPVDCCPEMSEITGPWHVEVGSIYGVTGGKELTATFNSGTLVDISVAPADGEEKLWRWEVTALNDPCADPAMITITDVCPEAEPNEKTLVVSCDPCPELFLSGSDIAVIGGTYTATGGQGSYTWDFDKGTISQSGVIQTIDSLPSGSSGIGLITVTDECVPQQTATLAVRFNPGRWTRYKWTIPGDDNCFNYGTHIPGVNELYVGSNSDLWIGWVAAGEHNEERLTYHVYSGDIPIEGCGIKSCNSCSFSTLLPDVVALWPSMTSTQSWSNVLEKLTVTATGHWKWVIS